MSSGDIPDISRQAVLQESYQNDIHSYSETIVHGYDFNEGINYQKLFQSFNTTGFQEIGRAHV